MWQEGKPVIEQRPDLADWVALICLFCKNVVAIHPKTMATAARCPCGRRLSNIHDLSQPCEDCLAASNEARFLIAREGLYKKCWFGVDVSKGR